MTPALLLIDIQNDFLPAGPLPVSQGDKVIPVANELLELFPLSIASKDWHPTNHIGFASVHSGKKPGDLVQVDGISQLLWPLHCVQGSKGAEFPASLHTHKISYIVYKGTDSKIDSYSAFFDNGLGKKASTNLLALLKDNQIDTLFIMGLATDYCVKFTALDARKLGFTTYVVEEGCKAIAQDSKSQEETKKQLQEVGVRCISKDKVCEVLAIEKTALSY